MAPIVVLPFFVSFRKPTIAVTLGDPGGIGPEVIVKALAASTLRSQARFRLYGPVAALELAARAASIAPFWFRGAPSSISGETNPHEVAVVDYPTTADFSPQSTRESGDLSFRLVDDAIADALRPARDVRHVSAIVTGPISKMAWKLAGHGQFPGHTELLSNRCGARRHGMMFVTPRLRVILATAHVPLMNIGAALTIDSVLDAIELGHAACVQLGVERPRVAVCGLNPHAGEGGVLGLEEQRIIEPAIEKAKERGVDARGPFPGDTVFNAATAGRFDLVVAMYHDQGLIPVKLLDRDRAVNMTVGLPIIRTSPDHGTAFDIAGQNKADAGSMTAAIELAIRLCQKRQAPA